MTQPYQSPNPVSESERASAKSANASTGYWSGSLRIVLFILALWAFLSLGCGILLRDWLDSALPNIGGAPFGFWMAQQGAIIGFLCLLFLYMILMNGLDRKHGYDSSDGGQV